MREDAQGSADSPGVIAPPPLIYAGALAAGLLANGLYPVALLPRGISRAFGLALVAGGASIGTWGFRTMRRAGTNVDPYKPATAIVGDGPYRYTRNPLYVGMTLMYGGVTLLANAIPAALLLPFVLAVMQRGVIEREERYLERKFGDEYLRYRGRVRRWI